MGLLCCPQVPIDIRKGITEEQVQTVVDGLAVRGDKKAAGQQIRGLYDLFVKADCTMVEVSRGGMCPLYQGDVGRCWVVKAGSGACGKSLLCAWVRSVVWVRAHARPTKG